MPRPARESVAFQQALSLSLSPTHLQDADARVERQPLLKVHLASRLLLFESPLRRKAQLARYPSPMASEASANQISQSGGGTQTAVSGHSH